MSVTSGLGSFNKDKVANKFGIQLKPKDAVRRPSTSSTEKKPTTTESSNVTKTKTNSDFRKDNNTNGFLSNTNRSTVSKTSEPTKKVPEKSSTSKPTSGLLNTSVNNERSNSLTSNVNHSTTKSREPSPSTSTLTTKRPSVIPTQRAVSPAPPPVKQPNASKTDPKIEAQIEHKKNQPLDKRQSSKPVDNTSSSAPTATTATASTNSLKR